MHREVVGMGGVLGMSTAEIVKRACIPLQRASTFSVRDIRHQPGEKWVMTHKGVMMEIVDET